MTKRKRCKGVFHFDRAENRYPGPSQRPNHPVKRFAKFSAEAGGKRHLKTDQRIDHKAFCTHSFDGVQNLLHGFIHRKVERTKVKYFEFSLFLRRFQIQTKTTCAICVACRALFKDRHNSRLATADSFGDKLRRHSRFSCARGPCHKETIALEDAAAHHFVQFGNAHRKPAVSHRLNFFTCQAQRARERLQSVIANTQRMQARYRCLPAQFHDLQFTHYGISLRNLGEPKKAIDDGE